MAFRNDKSRSTAKRRNKPRLAKGAQSRNSTSRQVDMGVAGGQYSRNNPQYVSTSAKKSRTALRVVFGTLCAFLIVAIGVGVAYALYLDYKGSIDKALAGEKTEEERQAIEDVLVPVKNYTDPFYMILVGSDKRASDSGMGQRSDTNILVRVDPANGIVTMVSIPRDTRIELDGYGTNKFNAAYSYGGISSTIREASQLCGVDISYYAEIDFDKLIQLVDVINGVEVDIPELINDSDAGSVVIQPGLQTLNGEAALVFARSRSYADGDFTRTANQRLLIEAIAKKILSMPLTDLPGVVQEAAQCVTTNFKTDDLIGMAKQFKEMKKIIIYSAMVPSTTATIGGISYVLSDVANLAEMMKLVDAGEDPSSLVNTVSDYGYIPPADPGPTGGDSEYEEPSDPLPSEEPPVEEEVPTEDIGGNNGSEENPGSGQGEDEGLSGEVPAAVP